jgi:transcriptional regulator with XRE-family HTH domain
MAARKLVDAIALGVRLKEARLLANLTLNDVQKVTGVSYTQVSRFERGDFRRQSKNLRIICKYLDVAIASDSLDQRDTRLEWALRDPLASQALEAFLVVLATAARMDNGETDAPVQNPKSP